MTVFDTDLNLVLTGFMGTGKTTIGKLVAERLGRRFVDIDHLIMQRAGRSVPEIFREHGESIFRAWEATFCEELSEPQGLVIATGGGALIPEQNRRIMQAPGNVVVCLIVEPNAVLQRLDGSGAVDRPLFGGDQQRFLGLMQERKPIYGKFRLKLDTTNLAPETAATAVIHLFERELERNQVRTPVHTPEGGYDILCMPGLLDKLPYILENLDLERRTAVVTNTTVAPLYGEAVVDSLPNATLLTIPDGETHKNLATVEALYSDFVAAGLDRHSLIIALGGGVVGDTVGYAAATYMRGIKLLQIPTTLLSMVDSSVGGKVGVDIPQGKNLVGAFKQPEIVIIDTDVLKSLPPVEIRSGMAEVIKHALLADPELLNYLHEVRSGDGSLIRRAIQVKVDVVQRDPYEQGERAHLNLGHTFAHAIEQVSGYRWRHGDAVGVGLVAAARLSNMVSTLSTAEVEQIESVVAEAGLPTRIEGFDPEDLWRAMHTDKKWRDGRSHFVILREIGQPGMVEDISRQQVLDVLASLQ